MFNIYAQTFMIASRAEKPAPRPAPKPIRRWFRRAQVRPA
ncbi:hypothetical protein SAMN04488047_101102 [Tranquillimonas alkanivorans]|uniref:Uncharacterized protein n=1 Tax=Tranquillimonas alkanivorans TaxID=441119 RepID=A0A1I5KH50_9RHOB|nr:hypothetical protein SAMN04488047_101102 [Tranquillimonas alkanivorans]